MKKRNKIIVFFITTTTLFSSCGTTQKRVFSKPVVKKELKSVKKVDIVPRTESRPIYVPPEVIRVLIYPYEDEKGILHQGEFLYFTARPGYWTIATRAEIYRADKYVKIVNTQKGLDIKDTKQDNIPLLKLEGEKPISKDKEKKLKVIEGYLKAN